MVNNKPKAISRHMAILLSAGRSTVPCEFSYQSILSTIFGQFDMIIGEDIDATVDKICTLLPRNAQISSIIIRIKYYLHTGQKIIYDYIFCLI